MQLTGPNVARYQSALSELTCLAIRTEELKHLYRKTLNSANIAQVQGIKIEGRFRVQVNNILQEPGEFWPLCANIVRLNNFDKREGMMS